jgi:hypothetical protein
LWEIGDGRQYVISKMLGRKLYGTIDAGFALNSVSTSVTSVVNETDSVDAVSTTMTAVKLVAPPLFFTVALTL